MQQKGLIYLITNKINGKQYVGQTISSIYERWSQHKCDSKRRNTALANAIIKYSPENFIVDTIEGDIDYEDLDDKEIMYIRQYDTVSPNGYNISNGGKSFRTDEERMQLSLRVKGENNPMYGMYGELNPFYGRQHTDTTKEIIGNFNKNRWDNLSEEEKEIVLKRLDDARNKAILNNGGCFKGKHHSDESKEAIRQKLKNRVFTDEHRRKIKENSTKRRRVSMIDKNTNAQISEFESMTDACAWLHENTNYSKAKTSEISSVCSGKKKSAYGYKWSYL